MPTKCLEIEKRYSCRNYQLDKTIAPCDIEKIIYTGINEPSGKNIKPWKFKIIEEKEQINYI